MVLAATSNSSASASSFVMMCAETDSSKSQEQQRQQQQQQQQHHHDHQPQQASSLSLVDGKNAATISSKSLLEEDDEDDDIYYGLQKHREGGGEEEEDPKNSSILLPSVTEEKGGAEDHNNDTQNPIHKTGFIDNNNNDISAETDYSDLFQEDGNNTPIFCSSTAASMDIGICNEVRCNRPPKLFTVNTDGLLSSDPIEMMSYSCRHPMEFFSVFDSNEGVEVSANADSNNIIPMAYLVPRWCEYCGSESTKQCPPSCQRPRSLFRKKRPPFVPPGPEWDPTTEEEIISRSEIQQRMTNSNLGGRDERLQQRQQNKKMHPGGGSSRFEKETSTTARAFSSSIKKENDPSSSSPFFAISEFFRPSPRTSSSPDTVVVK